MTAMASEGVVATTMASDEGVMATMAADARLARVRRVDWRFLLPRPEMGTVLRWGPLPRGLLQGLEAAGIEVVDAAGVEGADNGSHPMACEYILLAVMRHLSIRRRMPDPDIAGAIDQLAPGGRLIVEVHGLFRRPFAPRGWVARLQRDGLTQVEAYLHWPNFGMCSQIVPIDPGPAHALRYAVDRGAGGAWQRAIGRLVVASRLLPAAAPCFTIIGRKPGGDP